jgi:hypothetical protein
MGKLKELKNSLKVLSTDRDWYDDSTPTNPQDKIAHQVGTSVLNFLNIKVGRNGRVNTSYGAKNPVGVGHAIIDTVNNYSNSGV